jgi:hypothetical protein
VSLFPIRLWSRDDLQFPNPIISCDQVFPTYKAFESARIAGAPLNNGLVDSAAIACNPAHLSNMRLSDIGSQMPLIRAKGLSALGQWRTHYTLCISLAF